MNKNNILVAQNQEPMGRPTQGLLKKSEAAEFLGISLSEFKRREKAGIYVATERQGNKRMYDQTYLARRKKEIGKYVNRVDLMDAAARFKHEVIVAQAKVTKQTQNDTIYDPETAVMIFNELDRDEDLIRIVKVTGLHPSIVKAVHIDWVDLKKQSGGFHVSGESARSINSLELDGFPVSSGEEIVAALNILASTTKPCSTCKQKPRRTAHLCISCEQELIKRKQGDY